MRYEFETKPKKCPVCGSVKIADILYGLIAFSKELENDINSGKVVLGGCVLTGDDPSWQCVVCGTKFFKKKPNS